MKSATRSRIKPDVKLHAKPLITLLLSALVAATSLCPPDVLAAPQQSRKAKAGKVKKPAPAPVSDYYTGEFVNFGQWKEVQVFVDDMVSKHGFTRGELGSLLSNVRFLDSVVQLVKPAPPGKPKNWTVYSSRFIEPIRINAGVRFWNENAEIGRAHV